MSVPRIPLDNGHASSVVICAILFPSLATAAVIARFFARKKKQVEYGLDDYFVVLALLATYGQITILILGALYGGVGHHNRDVLPEHITFQYKMLAAVQFTFGTSVGLMKISICLLLIRIFGPKSSFRRAAWCVLGLCVAWTLMVISIGAGLCRPFSYNWNKNQEGKCGSLIGAFIAIAATDISIDTMIIILPMPWLWDLQMAKRVKVGLTFVFALGLLDIIVAILRIYYLVNTSYAPDADFLWVSTDEFIWSAIEPSLGVVVACAPVLGHYFPKTRTRSSQSSGPSMRKSRFGHSTKASHAPTISSPLPTYEMKALSSPQKESRTTVEDDEVLLNPSRFPRSQRSSS